jgi:hypothetical protein
MAGSRLQNFVGNTPLKVTPLTSSTSCFAQKIGRLLEVELSDLIASDLEKPELVVRNPRWPLEALLLIVRGKTSDRLAINFAFSLAIKLNTRLTTLCIIPDSPGFYRRCSQIQLDLPTLLKLDTEPGWQLGIILKRIFLHDLRGDIQICQGPPENQIRNMIALLDPDLVVISKEPYNRLYRFWFGEIIKPLLRWVDRPVLIS